MIADIDHQIHTLLTPRDPEQTLREPSGLLKMMVTNESAQNLFNPHWSPDGRAVAFEISTLELRFYSPVCVWNAADFKVQVLTYNFFRTRLKLHSAGWGTATEFAGWDGSKVLVRIVDDQDVRDDLPFRRLGLLLSYDICTGGVRREQTDR